MNNNIISRCAAQQALFAHRQQWLYDRYDALDEACRGIRAAIDALRAGGRPAEGADYGDDLAALEDIACGLGRDREEVSAELDRLEALDRRAIAREGACL